MHDPGDQTAHPKDGAPAPPKAPIKPLRWALPNSRSQAAVLPALEQARSRLVFIALFFLLFYLAIIARLCDVMLFTADAELRGADNTAAAALASPVLTRGDIVDRNGEVLATSLPMASLSADPALVLDAHETVRGLKKLFPDLDGKSLLEALQSKKRFIWIKRALSPSQQEQVNNLGLPGLSFTAEEHRVYPKGNLTAHIIGYTSADDHQGIAGLEKTLESRLHNQSDAAMPPVALSLDIRLQSILRENLNAEIKNFDALGGAGVIMDVHSGEVLALASLPDFNPNAQGQASDNAKFNRATLGVYEMGSTFKTFTLADALERHAITLADRFDCTHPLQMGKYTINDFHPLHRWLNVPEIFLHSSNIGAAQIAEKVGIAEQKSFLQSLGLLEASPIELPEVGKPIYPSEWREINMMTIAYGHGIAVSAVQLASAVASIINGGTLVKPLLLKPNPVTPALPGKRIISEATSAMMRQIMRVVVTQGTGKSANVAGYVVGGKTGTADKTGGHGGYNRNARLASFIAAFPIQNPKYLVFAMLDEPKGTKATYGFATGGWVAAPMVGRIISQIAPLLNITPVDENDPTVEAALRLPVPVVGE